MKKFFFGLVLSLAFVAIEAHAKPRSAYPVNGSTIQVYAVDNPHLYVIMTVERDKLVYYWFVNGKWEVYTAPLSFLDNRKFTILHVQKPYQLFPDG